MKKTARHWDWRAPDRELRPSARELRRKGAIQLVVASVIAALFWYLGHSWLALIAGSVGALSFALAMASPTRAYAALQRALERFGAWIGMVLSWVLLVPLYFLFFMPFGLLLRRGRRDPMQRQLEPGRSSYWRQREGRAPTLDDFRRQF